MKIRNFGFLANTNKRGALKTIRSSIGQEPPPEPSEEEPKETTAERILRLTGLDIAHCPKCKTKLIACPLPLPERPP